MVLLKLVLSGQGDGSTIEVEVPETSDLQGLKEDVAAQYGIVEPSGIAFVGSKGNFEDIEDVKAYDGSIAVTVDGQDIREPPGPPTLPYLGNYLEIYPDHLGNHQRLFQKYGPIIHTSNMGKVVYQVNDPELASIVFSESEFFTKQTSNENHPLFPLRNDMAGVFLADTDSPSWKTVHKFLPPALGPKAVRHYSPLMNQCVRGAMPVFDALEEQGDAWNVYQYMLKLGSETIGKIVLGMEFKQFTDIDAPLHPFVLAMAEMLSLNKKVATRGEWYGKMPFGDPAKLKHLQQWEADQIEQCIRDCKAAGTEDLPLQDATLKASCVIDYCVRATDSSGDKLPKDNLVSAVTVAAGAGFTTTSTLLSWLIYGLVTYEGMQTRLLQELVDNEVEEDTEITPELIEQLPFLTNYVKEMQRYHNPSYQPGRVARIDCILPGGYKLAAGSVVVPAIHHVHHNPKVWDNPSHFNPDRWKDPAPRHKAAYIPFALGPRSCIGFNFALQEVKIFLPKLVWRYEWFKEGETAVEYDPNFQLIRPVNLYVRTKKRNKWPTKSEAMQS